MEFSQLTHLAHTTDLDVVGVARVAPTPTWSHYRDWVARGYAGEMAYLTRPDAVQRRADPRHILPEAQSVLVVAASYGRVDLPQRPPLAGRVSRYAGGAEDYHRWLLRRLKALVHRIEEATHPFASRCYVDTGPILERAWAQVAGLGWIGKNTCLIHPRLGSYIFLGVALLGIQLPPPPQPTLPTCGTCTRCMDACPTHAIVAPGLIDARRCLAYLTIEHRGVIPEDLRVTLGHNVFGCDICQDVCPWNRKAVSPNPASAPQLNSILDLPALLTLTAEAFRARFRRTPLWRATCDGLARNSAIVLGNSGNPAARPHLQQAAHHHPSALVREHAVWALAQG